MEVVALMLAIIALIWQYITIIQINHNTRILNTRLRQMYLSSRRKR